jgi:hypothetical protein
MSLAPAVTRTAAAERGVTTTRGPLQSEPGRSTTDDEILGIVYPTRESSRGGRKSREEAVTVEKSSPPEIGLNFTQGDSDSSPSPDGESSSQGDDANSESEIPAEPKNLRGIFDANPELRRAWQDAQEYRQTFATPEEARSATALLADLNRMDALFFSRRPEDHAELARTISGLDSEAFSSLAHAMAQVSAETQKYRDSGTEKPGNRDVTRPLGPTEWNGIVESRPRVDSAKSDAKTASSTSRAPEQEQFFHATNAAAVQSVLNAIESQVEKLLPEGISKNARNRVVGEVYRELDSTLRTNRQLSQQMREAFRSGALDAEHQRAIVSLITARARQALPGVARRVLNEWTSTIVAASQDRRARQRAAERRVDIAGSHGGGAEGPRPISPRDLDYARMSDSDILNL